MDDILRGLTTGGAAAFVLAAVGFFWRHTFSEWITQEIGHGFAVALEQERARLTRLGSIQDSATDAYKSAGALLHSRRVEAPPEYGRPHFCIARICPRLLP